MVEWRRIPGFAAYEASELGQVRPVSPRYKVRPVEVWIAELVGEKIERRGQVLEPWIVTRHGRDAAYVRVGKSKQLVHRLVCLAFHGEPPPELTDCCHQNHNSLDNRASNLRWGTHSENIEEQWEKRREMQARIDDAIGHVACYNGPDPRSDVPF